jgi:hypothetical protein
MDDLIDATQRPGAAKPRERRGTPQMVRAS